MNTCTNCQHTASDAFVAMWDFCPNCKTTPFPGAEDTSTVGGYEIPVDPMDLLQCDSCQ